MEFLKRKSTIESSFRASLINLLISELTSSIGPLIDGIIISAFLGEPGVKEFGIINPLLIAYNALGSVFAVGTVTLCTRLVGKGKTKDKVEKIRRSTGKCTHCNHTFEKESKSFF